MPSLSCRAKATTTASSTTTTTTTTTITTTTTTKTSSISNAPMALPQNAEFQSGSDRISVSQTCPLNNFRSFVEADDSKIVNGQVAVKSSWPWIVRMNFRRGAGTALCGGSIIDDQERPYSQCLDTSFSYYMNFLT